MTDEEIGKISRKIAERGNTAEIKQNNDCALILEVKKIVPVKVMKIEKKTNRPVYYAVRNAMHRL